MDQLRSIAQENLISRGGLTSANAQDLIEQVNNLLTSINDLLLSYTGETSSSRCVGREGEGQRKGAEKGADEGQTRVRTEG